MTVEALRDVAGRLPHVEFEALAEYEPGMDRRRIDWKSSARHARLFAKLERFDELACEHVPVDRWARCKTSRCGRGDERTRFDRTQIRDTAGLE